MLDAEKFLERASKIESVISESKLLDIFAEYNKVVVICTQSNLRITEQLNELLPEISYLPNAKIHCIDINESEFTSEEISSCKISDSEFINMVLDISRKKNCIVYAVNEGIKLIAQNGVINTEVEACLAKTKTMQDQLNLLKPISELKEVFETFNVECQYKEYYYNKCFNSRGKIKAKIKEQELRNILLEFLRNKMKGEVDIEYCTSIIRDEESVDIYLNDGQEQAIIEVKFSFLRSIYEGKSFYKLQDKCLLGIEQLDRYAKHLQEDNRIVEYGFVYMFFHNANNEQELLDVETYIHNYVDGKTLSDAFYSIYQKIIFNNLALWKSKQ
ncbi:hypothetical protein HMPREF9395_0589 [Streptococcus sanguinis SK1058]|jgi:hypothetical protein|uniref:hypothetical protein n=1 Tax=Streptococcus sanguinis TaxID=1305 RepID=UPI000204C580|nr:hypothetical protein [Streptococcus sanguinis]EGF21850.1 hypothetical protein HMPREF9395_0589 [Streptococcus sanguinis SK1058]